MRDALSPHGDPSSTDEHQTLTSREFVALTGISAERVRTWQRRFGFPASTPDRRGRRGFFTADVPRVLAVKQMVAAGEPVAEAVRDVLAGRAPRVDLAVLEESFGALSTPVVALQGPSPAQVLWANSAALATAPAYGHRPRLPYSLGERNSTLQHLLIEPPDAPVWFAHQPWFAPPQATPAEHLVTPLRAMAWSCGPPAFVPAVLIVIDVPEADDDRRVAERVSPAVAAGGREPSHADHDWAVAVSGARRALQRGAGGKAIDQALGALAASGAVADAILVIPHGDELRPILSARGRAVPTALDPDAGDDLRSASGHDRPAALTVAAAVLAGPGAHAAAVPLMTGRAELGYLVLVTREPLPRSHTQDGLIMGLGAALAASLSRDRALGALRRARGD